jgi:cobalt/nickel transport system permease protein
MEGYLKPVWCISWIAVSLPFLIIGFFKIKNLLKEDKKMIVLLAIAGAYTFLLSSLKIPSVTGSCSHPTGVGLGGILFGPFVMSILGFIVLLFQATLLAHGGLTTIGANTFSMAIVGSIVSFIIYRIGKKLNVSQKVSVFLAASLGNLTTYIVTSFQLAAGFHGDLGFYEALTRFLGVFAVTQIPLAISEGILTVIIFTSIKNYNKNQLSNLKVEV